MSPREVGPPTEFEALTAAAITELARREVDLAIVEVGMGGRLDATNVLDLGVAAITNVQRDHEAYLGSTLTAIGGEKAPIIKRGNLAVTGASGRGLRPILDRCADARRAAAPRRTVASRIARGCVPATGTGSWSTRARRPASSATCGSGCSERTRRRTRRWRSALLDALRASDGTSRIDDRPPCAMGSPTARWPGRLELLDGCAPARRVLLDGAHNPAGAAALADALRDLGLERPTIVFGAMRAKDVRGVLRALAPLRPRLVVTSVDDPGAARAGRARQGLASTSPERVPRWRPHRPRRCDIAAGDPLVVAGSLYLVGEVRGMITGTREDD